MRGNRPHSFHVHLLFYFIFYLMEKFHKLVCSSARKGQDGKMFPFRKKVLFQCGDIEYCRFMLAEFFSLRSTDSDYSDCSPLENDSFSVSRDNKRYTYSVE